MLENWVRVRRVGEPTIEQASPASPRPDFVQVHFELAPKFPEVWARIYQEKVGPARDLPGGSLSISPSGATGWISSPKDDIEAAVAKLDSIIDSVNDNFEAYQREIDNKIATNQQRAAEVAEKRGAAQSELEARAEKLARPPFEPGR